MTCVYAYFLDAVLHVNVHELGILSRGLSQLYCSTAIHYFVILIVSRHVILFTQVCHRSVPNEPRRGVKQCRTSLTKSKKTKLLTWQHSKWYLCVGRSKRRFSPIKKTVEKASFSASSAKNAFFASGAKNSFFASVLSAFS